MNIFFDTEFTGLRKNAKLISIGLISEDNKKFYAEFNDYGDFDDPGNWIHEHVIQNLLFDPPKRGEQEYYSRSKKGDVMMRGNSNEIRQELISWFELFSENKVYMWSDVLAYDCVLFNDLFYSDNATAEYGLGLPKGICYIPFDIATLMKAKGVYYDISREEFAEVEDVVDFMETLQAHYTDVKTKHNALWDAIIIKKCYEKLMKL